MRRAIVSLMGMVLAAGCANRTSSLLLERHAIGPLAEASSIGRPAKWQLDPATQTLTEGSVEVHVTFASPEYLQTFFNNKEVFGSFAGLNPYYPENIVFYVQVANRSAKRVRLSPADFVVVDDRGNQYAALNVDYVTAIEEHRAPFASTTRTILEDARPGYFGLSFPVGKFLAAMPQHRFALIKQSSLQAGWIYPGVMHDGLIAFWSPSQQATTLRLLLANVKADFNANDAPQTVLEFPFSFHATTK